MKKLIEVLKQLFVKRYCYWLGSRIIKKKYQIELLKIKLRNYEQN